MRVTGCVPNFAPQDIPVEKSIDVCAHMHMCIRHHTGKCVCTCTRTYNRANNMCGGDMRAYTCNKTATACVKRPRQRTHLYKSSFLYPRRISCLQNHQYFYKLTHTHVQTVSCCRTTRKCPKPCLHTSLYTCLQN